MGLWSNVLDYDGIDKYLFEDYRKLHRRRTRSSPLLTVGTPAQSDEVPVLRDELRVPRATCSRPRTRCRWIARSSPGYPIWRFDDIWAGYVIEALVHKRGGADVIGDRRARRART